MTVQELIKELQRYNPSAPVVTRTKYDDYDAFTVSGAHQNQLGSFAEGADNRIGFLEDFEGSDPHQSVVVLDIK